MPLRQHPAFSEDLLQRLAVPAGPAVRFRWISTIAVRRFGSFARHRHAEYELLAIQRGTYRARIDGRAVSAAGGTIVVVQPGEEHEDLFAPGVRFTGVGLRLDAAVASPPLLRADAPRVLSAPASTAALLRGLRREALVSDQASQGLLDAGAGRLFWELARLVPAADRDPAWAAGDDDHRFLRDLDLAFAAVIAVPVAVRALAGRLGLGPTAFTARCRRLLGLAPAAALRLYRLERARLLLLAGDIAVGEAAARCGFASQFHFSRAFARRYGHPPSALHR